MLLQKGGQLLARVVLLRNAIANIRTIKAGNKLTRIVEPQPFDNLLAGQSIGGRSQSNARNLRKALVQNRKLNILRTEIMSPLGHAMRFIDGKQCNPRAL